MRACGVTGIARRMRPALRDRKVEQRIMSTRADERAPPATRDREASFDNFVRIFLLLCIAARTRLDFPHRLLRRRSLCGDDPAHPGALLFRPPAAAPVDPRWLRAVVWRGPRRPPALSRAQSADQLRFVWAGAAAVLGRHRVVDPLHLQRLPLLSRAARRLHHARPAAARLPGARRLGDRRDPLRPRKARRASYGPPPD